MGSETSKWLSLLCLAACVGSVEALPPPDEMYDEKIFDNYDPVYIPIGGEVEPSCMLKPGTSHTLSYQIDIEGCKTLGLTIPVGAAHVPQCVGYVNFSSETECMLIIDLTCPYGRVKGWIDQSGSQLRSVAIMDLPQDNACSGLYTNIRSK